MIRMLLIICYSTVEAMNTNPSTFNQLEPFVSLLSNSEKSSHLRPLRVQSKEIKNIFVNSHPEAINEFDSSDFEESSLEKDLRWGSKKPRAKRKSPTMSDKELASSLDTLFMSDDLPLDLVNYPLFFDSKYRYSDEQENSEKPKNTDAPAKMENKTPLRELQAHHINEQNVLRITNDKNILSNLENEDIWTDPMIVDELSKAINDPDDEWIKKMQYMEYDGQRKLKDQEDGDFDQHYAHLKPWQLKILKRLDYDEEKYKEYMAKRRKYQASYQKKRVKEILSDEERRKRQLEIKRNTSKKFREKKKMEQIKNSI